MLRKLFPQFIIEFQIIEKELMLKKCNFYEYVVVCDSFIAFDIGSYIIQLMYSFEVDIRICQPQYSDVIEAKPR